MNRFIFLISLVFLGFHPPVLIASENAAARPAVKPAPVLSIEERKELSQLCYKAGLDAHLSGDQERAMKYWWLMSKLDPDWLERKSLDTKEGREQFLKHSQKIGGESSPQ